MSRLWQLIVLHQVKVVPVNHKHLCSFNRQNFVVEVINDHAGPFCIDMNFFVFAFGMAGLCSQILSPELF